MKIEKKKNGQNKESGRKKKRVSKYNGVNSGKEMRRKRRGTNRK
ncbi:hypothetical protein [Clostridioides difficile]|nr:hypothetical protein [Clostridioides difficile]